MPNIDEAVEKAAILGLPAGQTEIRSLLRKIDKKLKTLLESKGLSKDDRIRLVLTEDEFDILLECVEQAWSVPDDRSLFDGDIDKRCRYEGLKKRLRMLKELEQ